jgi:hypothetical protein
MGLHTDRSNTHRRLCRSGSRSPTNAAIGRPQRPKIQNHAAKITNKKSGSLRLKSEISFLPTRAAKTRTGVAVHENLLDSVMAAPLKRESLLERPNPMHGLDVDQPWQSENLDA